MKIIGLLMLALTGCVATPYQSYGYGSDYGRHQIRVQPQIEYSYGYQQPRNYGYQQRPIIIQRPPVPFYRGHGHHDRHEHREHHRPGRQYYYQ